ncbi:MAG: sulfurtransferase-like selenium metabolism protein YedF [Desulfobacterales bacterium]
MKQIDARNRDCPAPVLITKQAIEAESPEEIKVMVDNQAACQNVSRFFNSIGYDVKAETVAEGFEVIGTISSQGPGSEKEAESGTGPEKKIMVMLTTDRMGYGDDTLGCKLMVNFVNTLNEMGPDLWRLVLVNNGVKLAVKGSEVLATIRQLENYGVGVLVCGTCLDHYGLLEQKQAGQTTNMLDIVTSMQLSDQVINI